MRDSVVRCLPRDETRAEAIDSGPQRSKDRNHLAARVPRRGPASAGSGRVCDLPRPRLEGWSMNVNARERREAGRILPPRARRERRRAQRVREYRARRAWPVRRPCQVGGSENSGMRREVEEDGPECAVGGPEGEHPDPRIVWTVGREAAGPVASGVASGRTGPSPSPVITASSSAFGPRPLGPSGGSVSVGVRGVTCQ